MASYDESEEYYYDDAEGGSGYGDSYAEDSVNEDGDTSQERPPEPPKPDMLYLPAESKPFTNVRKHQHHNSNNTTPTPPH